MKVILTGTDCRTVILSPVLTLPLTVGLVLVKNASLPPQSSPR